mmetsp:Transcript_14263/g.23725  ORF Transcript_14263/g.23725 Transcript_14263/m.23725 type:complete len:312 (-) Transcript_14263:1024-1959(-)
MITTTPGCCSYTEVEHSRRNDEYEREGCRKSSAAEQRGDDADVYISATKIIYHLCMYTVVPIFVLFYWRGTWILCDVYVPANNLEDAGWWAILIGYGGLLVFAAIDYGIYLYVPNVKNTVHSHSYYSQQGASMVCNDVDDDNDADVELGATTGTGTVTIEAKNDISGSSTTSINCIDKAAAAKVPPTSSCSFALSAYSCFVYDCIYQRKLGVWEIAIALGTRLRTYILAFLAVNCWRGLWLLQDAYLLPSDLTLSAWTSHLLGCFVLLIVCHFQSSLAPPVTIAHDRDWVEASFFLKSFLTAAAAPSSSSS